MGSFFFFLYLSQVLQYFLVLYSLGFTLSSPATCSTAFLLMFYDIFPYISISSPFYIKNISQKHCSCKSNFLAAFHQSVLGSSWRSGEAVRFKAHGLGVFLLHIWGAGTNVCHMNLCWQQDYPTSSIQSTMPNAFWISRRATATKPFLVHFGWDDVPGVTLHVHHNWWGRASLRST